MTSNKFNSMLIAILISFCLIMSGSMVSCGGGGGEDSTATKKTRKSRSSRSRDSKTEDSKELMDQSMAKKETEEVEIAMFKSDEIYNPVGRRDPFLSLIFSFLISV